MTAKEQSRQNCSPVQALPAPGEGTWGGHTAGEGTHLGRAHSRGGHTGRAGLRGHFRGSLLAILLGCATDTTEAGRERRPSWQEPGEQPTARCQLAASRTGSAFVLLAQGPLQPAVGDPASAGGLD